MSSAKTTMTEQSVVINRLYSTLIAKASNMCCGKPMLMQMTWSGSVLTPLMHQIKDHKKQIENRLHMLKKMNDSKGTVDRKYCCVRSRTRAIEKRQRNELMMMIKAMQLNIHIRGFKP